MRPDEFIHDDTHDGDPAPEGDRALPPGVRSLVTLAGQTDKVTAVAFAPGRSDRLLSSGRDGSVAVWDLPAGLAGTRVGTGTGTNASGDASGVEAELIRHDAAVMDAFFWPDANGLVLSSGDGTARLVDIASGDETLRLTRIESMRADVPQQGRLVRSIASTANAAGVIVAAIVPLGGLLAAASQTKDAGAGVVSAAVDAAQGRAALLDASPAVTLYDLLAGEPIRTWKLPSQGPLGVWLTERGVVAASSEHLLVYAGDDPKPVARFRPGRGPLRSVVRVGPTSFVCAVGAKHLERVELASGMIVPLRQLTGKVSHAAPLGARGMLLARSDRVVEVCAVPDRGPACELVMNQPIRAIAGSDDGCRIAVAGSDHRVRLFELKPSVLRVG